MPSSFSRVPAFLFAALLAHRAAAVPPNEPADEAPPSNVPSFEPVPAPRDTDDTPSRESNTSPSEAEPSRSEAEPSEEPPPVDYPESTVVVESVAREPKADSFEPDEPDDSEDFEGEITLGLQWAFASEQIAAGPVLAVGGEGFWLDLEAPFLFTTKEAPELTANFLGNRWGIHGFWAPHASKTVRVRVGLGGDFYSLWGIHGDEFKAALALRADVTYWVQPNLGAELGVRGYPLSSEGLSVVRGPGGLEGVPVFLTAALHYRWGGEELK